MRQKLQKILFLLTLVILLTGVVCIPITHGKKDFYYFFATKEPFRPTRIFSPSDEILLYVSWPRLAPGDHHFYIEWINPAGKVQDTSETHVHMDKPGPYHFYFWLRINPGTSYGIAGLSSGYAKFIGDWKIRLYHNDRLILKDGFTIE